MPRFFITPGDIRTCEDETSSGSAGREPSPTVTVIGDDARHIARSLRMREGEHLVLCDGAGTDYECIISDITSSEIRLSVISSVPTSSEPPYRATVYQALVRGEKFDTVVQKSVECGAVRIVPYIASRSTVQLDPSVAERKCQRWQRIASEAAKQCGRGILPEVTLPISFSDALAEAALSDKALFCYEAASLPVRDTLTEGNIPRSISVMIGPEGGFSAEESAAASSKGLSVISLGRRILRTESAAPFILACLAYEFDR